MADRLPNLLEAIVADPGAAARGSCPALGARSGINCSASGPRRRRFPMRTVAIHHRFERQVERSPDAVALVCGEESFTYRDLNRLSNSLAHRLIELGVRPETVVGLYLDRWPSRIVGLLGVLKAGGAYLPLDPDHPAERLAAMLEDSGATVLVTEEHLRDRLPGCPPLVVALDPLARIAQRRTSRETPGCALTAKTSPMSSSPPAAPGGPRVSWSHTAACSPPPPPGSTPTNSAEPPLRHLQAAGFAFDVFTGDWVRALTTGGTLVACPRPVLLDPAALADLIRRERIECLELVPALADALAAHLERQGEDLGGVRLLAVGSDTVRGRLYRRLCRLMRPGGRVVNSYGLTEATIDSTYFGGTPADLECEDGPVPIGRPLLGHAGVRPGRAARAGSTGCGRRALYRRLGRGAGLRRRSATDGRAVRAGPAR